MYDKYLQLHQILIPIGYNFAAQFMYMCVDIWICSEMAGIYVDHTMFNWEEVNIQYFASYAVNIIFVKAILWNVQVYM